MGLYSAIQDARFAQQLLQGLQVPGRRGVECPTKPLEPVTSTFIAVAAVIAVIGYRVFKGEERVRALQSVSATLPAGTKVLSSAIGEGRVVLTVEVNGAIELLSFDLNTLKPLGRVRLAQ